MIVVHVVPAIVMGRFGAAAAPSGCYQHDKKKMDKKNKIPRPLFCVGVFRHDGDAPGNAPGGRVVVAVVILVDKKVKILRQFFRCSFGVDRLLIDRIGEKGKKGKNRRGQLVLVVRFFRRRDGPPHHVMIDKSRAAAEKRGGHLYVDFVRDCIV